MNYLISLLVVLQACFYLSRVSKTRGKDNWVITLIYFEVIYNLIINFIVGNTVLPSMFNYVSDAVMIAILFGALRQNGGCVTGIPRSMLAIAGGLWLLSLISYALNLYSPLLYLWGFRNNFRFIVFAMVCACYLEREDFELILEILFGFFLTNVAVVTWQFLILDRNRLSFGDFISGLYNNGAERGGNEALAWLISIVCIWQTVKYLNEGGNTGRLALVWAGALYMAAVAEIKLVIVVLVLGSMLALMRCRKSGRSVALVIFSVLTVFLGIQLMYLIFPLFKDLFTIEQMLSYVTREEGYATLSGGLDRLTALPYVFTNYLLHWPQKLFGIGLGNADYSSFSFLTSDFYRLHSWTGYSYFSSAFLTLELGAVGFAGFIVWYGNFARQALVARVRNIQEKTVRDTVLILSLIAVVMIFSNQSLKMESSAYMVTCVLSFVFLLNREDDHTPLAKER